MIFAELQVEREQLEFHDELASFLGRRFPKIDAGVQCDSCIRVFDGDAKVSVDNFTSYKHQVNAVSCPLVERVIDALAGEYPLRRFNPPVLQEHEEG